MLGGFFVDNKSSLLYYDEHWLLKGDNIMVDFAIWILAACIVVPFVIVVAAGGIYLLVRFWWVFAILVIALISWYNTETKKQEARTASFYSSNISKQAACIKDVNDTAMAAYRSQKYTAYQINTVSEQYRDNCRGRYPTGSSLDSIAQ
jgi:hypothetical protein